MRKYPLRIAEEFHIGVASIYAERLLDQIRNTLETVSCFPEIGSPNVRPCLTQRYGAGIRKMSVASFVIIYRFDGKTVDVLSIVHGRSIT